MFFNFDLFTKLAKKAYDNVLAAHALETGSPYLFSLDDTLAVFKHYFRAYEVATGAVHPNIRAAQIERIILRMPSLDGDHRDIDPADYPVLIDKHFRTEYRAGCDFNINHFFSGDIRTLRHFEELY